MLNRDLLIIERDAVRQATGVLTAASDASESSGQRDARARDLLADIVDSIPEGSRLDDNSFEAVIQAGINDLYYLGPIEELLPDTSISEIMVNAPDAVDDSLAYVGERGQARPATPQERSDASVLIAGTTLEVRS